MRVFVLTLTLAFVLLPVLLILLASQRSLLSRVLWALAAFLAPFATYGLTRMIAHLNNNSPDSTQWERFFGLLLSGSGFVLPWILFAIFLHGRRKEMPGDRTGS